MSRLRRRVVPFGWQGAALLMVMDAAMASPFGSLFAGTPPATLDAPGGRLAPCPDRPNCVSSEAADAEHAIAPLAIRGDPASAMRRLADAIRTMPGATVVALRADYLRVEFASALFGFVDDAEFTLLPGAPVIQVRSAARLGYSDMGVNRKRIEAIRIRFAG